MFVSIWNAQLSESEIKYYLSSIYLSLPENPDLADPSGALMSISRDSACQSQLSNGSVNRSEDSQTKHRLPAIQLGIRSMTHSGPSTG